MTRTIERIARTAIFAVAFMLSATSAWAAADMINVNLYETTTYSAVSGRSPTSNMGYLSYAVQNTYWSDIAANNGSGTAKLYDSSIPGQLENTVSVAVTGASGAYHPESGFDYTLLSGYIDDNATMTPTITLSSVPFDYYRVIVYFATDSYTRKYGHITLNDKLNIYGVYSSDLDEGYTDIGTNGNEGWGGCAPYQTVAGSKVVYMKEGRNVLISPVVTKTTDSSVKIESHALKTSDWVYRSCVAAVQVVKADTPATCTYTAPGTDTYNLFGAGNWDVEPASGSEAVTIAISGNTTLTVNDSRVFRSLTITGSGELTFAGTGTIITPSLTIGSGITLVKTAGNISSSATVSVPSGCTFEIASACTWSGVISGAGSVAVSGREVVFSAANTYTGNLTIKSGGAAKSANTSAFGPDWRSVERYVVVEDGGVADINGNGMVLAYKIAGDGAGSGALISTGGNIADGIMQTKKIILTADASIGGTADWGLLANSHYATEMTLGSYTLTKKGSANFWICNATISGTGSFVIEAGTAKTIYNVYKSTCNDGKIKVKDGGKLWIGTANLDAKSVTCDVGGTVEVSSGRQLLIKNGGDMTVNGTATITGTLKLAEDETASSTGTLTVGGTVTVTGTVDIPHRANIVRSGTGKVDIKSGGKVHYNYVFKNVNSKYYGWKSDYEGDVFTGAGTLEIRTNRTSTHDATSSFSGIVKLYTASASNTGYINVLDGLTFTQRPEFITEGYYNLGNTSTLAVRDLSGSGVFWSNYSPSNLKYIDTKQTKPTTFSGTFLKDDADSNTRDVGLTVRGSEDGVYALTLSGASTSRTALTIQDNGKVIFPSTGGSWSSGTVVVANGGYIEAQNTSALGTVDIQSGSVIVIPTVSEAPVALTCSTVTLPTSGTVTVDLSGVSVGEGESVTVISATSLVNANASIFRQTEGGWRFSVDNNTIKATKLGTATWSDGTWSDSDLTGYASASITASGTQDVTLPATTSFDTLTITGSGTVTLTSTSSETCTVAALSIGAGVTLNASSSLVLAEGCAISGEGTLDIPVGTTCTMNGVTCSAKVTVEGTLRTTGTTNLSAANTSAAGSLIEVVAGTTTLSSEWQGIAGDITVDANATLAMSKSLYNGSDYYYNHIAPGGNSRINVTGTIALGSSYFWNFGANVKLLLHKNGEITGSRTDYGSIGWTGNGSVVVDGDATINAPIRINDNISPILTVEDNVTLTISKAFLTSISNPSYGSVGGSITKAGAGTLDLTAITPTKPITINAGTVVADEMPTTTITINENGTFTLKDCAWTGNSNVFVGTGTLYLNYTKTTNDKVDHSVTGSTFSGTLKVGVLSNKAAYFNQNPALQLTGNPTLRLECGTQESPGSFYLGNSAIGHTLSAKNLSGWGIMTPWFGVNGTATFNIEQTDDTEFFGTFIDWQGTSKKLGLTVSGGSTVKSLTLSGENTTSGPLAIQNNAKVVFSGSGSWLSGSTTVKSGGVLESQRDAQVVGNLTLEDGSTLSFAEGYSLQVGAITLPASGTVTLDVSKLTLSDSGTTLMTFSTAPSASDVVNKMTVSGAALKLENSTLKAYPVATVTTFGSDAVVAYPSVQEAIDNASALIGQYVTAYQSETVTAAGQILLKIADGAVVTLNSSKAGYAYDVGTSIGEGIYMFSDNVQVAATFKWKTSVASGSWGTIDNWTSDDGTVSRMPGSLDTVIFESAALVETPVGGFSFAALQANASVTIKRDKLAIDDRLTRTVSAYGAISGTGSLTLNDGVNLANASRASLSIGVPVAVAGATALTVAEGVAASFTGSGTLTLDAITSTPIVGDSWTGTVWLKNQSDIQIIPANYGNANSVIRFTGITGWIADGTTCSPAFEFVDEGDTKALTLNSYSTTTPSTITFNEFRGSGTFATVGGTADAYPRTNFRILKWDDFVGSLDVDRGRAVFGTDTISNDDWRYIYISEDADVTIAAGKSFTANQGLRVYGELTVESNDALSSKAVQGSGTIIYEVAPNNGTTKPSFHATLWTGVVEFQEFAAAGIKLAEYGTSNSKIKINGITSGHLMWEDQNVQAEVVLAGDVNITATSHRNYTYAHISGTGSFSVSNSNSAKEDPSSIVITQLDVSAGSVGMAVTNNTATTLAINKLVLPNLPLCDTKVLAVGGTGEISLDVGNVKVNEESLPAKYKLERRHEGEEGDGFYVYYNGTIFSVY